LKSDGVAGDGNDHIARQCGPAPGSFAETTKLLAALRFLSLPGKPAKVEGTIAWASPARRAELETLRMSLIGYIRGKHVHIL
jgi:hypothetical protein